MEEPPRLEERELERLRSLELPEGTSCLVCFEDLEKSNMVGYQVSRESEWSVAKFCLDCVKQLLKIQFHKYLAALATTNCAKEQRTLLDRGPPVNVSDRLGFPDSGGSEVYSLFDFGAFSPLSPRLDGSLVRFLLFSPFQTGQARQDLWDELNKFRFKNDTEE